MASQPPPPPPPPSYLGSLSPSLSLDASWAQWLAEQFRSSWALAAGVGVATTGLTAAGLAIWWRRRNAQLRRDNHNAGITRRRRRRRPASPDASASPDSSAAAAPASAASVTSLSPRRRTHMAPPAASSSSSRPLSPLHIPRSRSPTIVTTPPFHSRVSARPPSPLMQPLHPHDAEQLLPPKSEPHMPDQAASSSASSSSASAAPTHSPQPISFSSCLTAAAAPTVSLQPASSHSSSSSSSSTALIVRPSTPSRQRILFDFGEAGDVLSNRHALRVLGAVLLVVTLLLLLDPTWLAPISPVLLYSMFTVAQERSRIDDSDITDGASSSSASAIPAPRGGDGPTQAVSLFGYSMRVPAPSARRPAGRPQLGQPSGPLQHSSASAHGVPRPSLAASSSATPSQPRIPAPILSASASSSSSSHTPIAVPFPSLTASPPFGPALNPAGSMLQGSSGLVLQQPRPLRALADPPVLADGFVEEEEELAGAVTSVVEPSVQIDEAAQRKMSQQEEHKESAVDDLRPPRADLGPASGIAASLSHSFTTRKIDVNAALSRLSPQHVPISSSSSSGGSSVSRRRVMQEEASAGDLLSAGESTGSASASASDAEATSDAERAFFSGQSRRDALDALPQSAASSSSVRMHFTFQASFEDVMDAFWRLGSEQSPADSDDTEQSSDSNTPPYTPTKLTPSTSLHHLVQQAAGHAPAASAAANSSLTSPAPPSGHAPTPLFTRAEYVADVISDSYEARNGAETGAGAGAGASSSSSSSNAAASSSPIRYVIRRVHTPMHLPHMLRKLLGNVVRLSLEERIQVDMTRRLVRLHLHSRVLDSYLHVSSVQSIAPHPLHPAHTRWTCDIKLHVYSSCGLMRQQVMSWLSAATKQRQQQISMMLSAAVKRAIKKRARQAYLQEQRADHANQQQQHEQVHISAITPTMTHRRGRTEANNNSSSSHNNHYRTPSHPSAPIAGHSSRRA